MEEKKAKANDIQITQIVCFDRARSRVTRWPTNNYVTCVNLITMFCCLFNKPSFKVFIECGPVDRKMGD